MDGAAEASSDPRSAALAYLRGVLGDRAPADAQPVAAFDERPLDGEGPVHLFEFPLTVGGGGVCEAAAARHFVVVGETEPNYFPAYDLTPDEAYSFHVGTRFMLVMEIEKVDATLEPPGARERMRQFVAQYARGAALESEEVAGLFRCEEAYLAVYRLRLAGEDVYCMGGDGPPGFYRKTQYAPQMALRLHLGHAIRAEARQAAAHGEADAGAP